MVKGSFLIRALRALSSSLPRTRALSHTLYLSISLSLSLSLPPASSLSYRDANLLPLLAGYELGMEAELLVEEEHVVEAGGDKVEEVRVYQHWRAGV